MDEGTLKTKRCPHYRQLMNETAVIHDGDRPFYEYETCIGSACSQFREHIVNHANVPADGSVDRTHPYDQGWRIVRSVIPKDGTPDYLFMEQVRGVYCGLAGKP